GDREPERGDPRPGGAAAGSGRRARPGTDDRGALPGGSQRSRGTARRLTAGVIAGVAAEPASTAPVAVDEAPAVAGAADDGRLDGVIVGAGIVGLATALRLLEARPGLRLEVIEQEAEPARHQSGHNSGVVHAGLYYAPGSLKARL